MFSALLQRKTFFSGLRLASAMLPFGLFIAMFEFALPLKLKTEGTEVFIVGAFISFSWIITTLLDIYWGSIIDRIGKKKSILFGMAMFALFATGFALTDNIFYLLFFSIFAYLGFDIMYIALEGYLICISVRRYFNYTTSGFFPIWSLAFIGGPLLTYYIYQSYGFDAVFLLAIPLALLATGIFGYFFRTKSEIIHSHSKRQSDFKFFTALFRKEILLLSGIFACAFWYTTMSVGIPLLYLIEEENILHSALVTSAFALPFFFTDFIGGFLAKNQFKRLSMIAIGFFVGGLSLIGLFLSKGLLFGMIFAFLSTTGINLAWAVFEIEAGLLANVQTAAKVESAFILSKNLGWDTSPFVFGLLSFLFNARVPFVVLGIVFIGLSGLFIYQRRRVK